ncbi:hypothetical protein WJX77_005120 [Trebouxia sp. C0004]
MSSFARCNCVSNRIQQVDGQEWWLTVVTNLLDMGDDKDGAWTLEADVKMKGPCKVVGYQLRTEGDVTGGARFRFACPGFCSGLCSVCTSPTRLMAKYYV